ncbi:MAG: peptidoglycan-binding protein [Synechococcaceae cyanobacterium RL_1_2]|nr:peptidoglycan-binding protein [Synechococcaceae cyanobacterium RL_1_2]
MKAIATAIVIAISIPFYPNVSSSPVMAVVTSDTVPRPTLSINSQGTLVEELHATLQLLGYYSGPITNVYDQNTFSAVALFQKAAGIKETGVMDNTTWNVLLPTSPPSGTVVTPAATASPAPAATANNTANVLKEGDKGDKVRLLQLELIRLGFLSTEQADGQFGPTTKGAVLRAQARYGLTTDGVVGPQTWAALKRN